MGQVHLGPLDVSPAQRGIHLDKDELEQSLDAFAPSIQRGSAFRSSGAVGAYKPITVRAAKE
jgi:hypothetical protein